MNIKRLLSTILLLSFSTQLFASLGEQDVRQILKGHKLGNADAAVYAISLPSGRLIASVNKDEPLNPASCMKLVTSAVALNVLGPNYRFQTRFYLTGGAAGEVKPPDLWVKGYGDPSFVIERMTAVVAKLIHAGLPATIGNIYLDDGFFEGSDYPGRQRRSKRAYNAPTGALTLNHGSITVEVFPASKIGVPAIVKTDAPGLIAVNKARTSARRSRSSVRMNRVYTKKGDTVHVSGRVALGSAGKRMFFNVGNPTEHFGMVLMAQLKDNGIRVTGDVGEGSIPAGAKLFYEERSEPLHYILKNMNKFSSNFIAEQITKVLGAVKYGAPGTTEKGTAVYDSYLRSLGARDFYVENGSGLSYRNRISANDLLIVMKDVYNDRALRDHYIESLSVAGEDGTLRKSRSGWLNGRLRAKTGTLNGVSTLAGFIPDRGQMIVFVVMLNGGRIDFWTGRKVSQKIAETLLELNRP